MLTPKRTGVRNPDARTDGEQAWREAVDRRLTRIETVLTKLAMHVGMDPRTGKPLRKDHDQD